jgi:serine/threonine protein kinase
VVHRDIKPQNLLLASDGLGRERLMVADLGVAKALIHASGLTDVVGTPAYMAPEQALGGGIDERADVHGLAAVAYHLLTGHVARNGGVTDLVHASLPPAPSVFVPVTPQVDAAILRGLEPDRENRWPDVASFVDALSACAPDAGTTYGGLDPRGSALAQRGKAGDQAMVVLAVWCLVVAVATFGTAWAAVSLLR